MLDDTYYMQIALNEARMAMEEGEVPVGCVITCNNVIIAKAHNLTQTLNDTTSHAEMQAFTAATSYLGSKYLHNCTLYVTLEPCNMCAAASAWTQISRIVYGTPDVTRSQVDKRLLLHPKTLYEGGLLAEECKALLTQFFKSKRL